MAHYFVYEIRHVETGRRYIGMSRGHWTKRLTDHVRLLRAGLHHSKCFQEAWDKSLGITDWSFRVLNHRVPSARKCRRFEMFEVSEVPESQRLNERTGSGIDGSTIAEVHRLRSQGAPLGEISDRLRIAKSTASKIINGRPPYDLSATDSLNPTF